MVTNSQTQAEIMGVLIRHWRDAEAEGRDPWRVLSSAFPGIPATVLADVFLQAEDDNAADWWSRVERAIDDELAARALRSAGTGTINKMVVPHEQ